MKTTSLQMIVVELSDGRRGVFFGAPLLLDQGEETCQVHRMWITEAHQIPSRATVEEITQRIAGPDCIESRSLQ